MYRLTCLLLLAVFFNVNTVHAQDKLLLRQPAINNDGSLVAFSFQGDIWTVPSTGGRATRLTIHEAYESNPVFSPDGRQIAFSGDRYGNNDIFVMPVTGGLPKRLTWHSAADNIASWTQPGAILFSTNRDFKRMERPSEVYSISPGGGTEKRILDAVGFDPVVSPNGRFLAFVRGDINPVARYAYTGSSNRDIWLYDTKSKTYTQLPGFKTNDIFPQWAGNNKIYFLSSNDGAYNLYRLSLDDNGKASGKPEKITNYTDESIRSFSISANGTDIVFERDMNLYTMKADKGTATKLMVQISADDRLDPTEQKVMTSGASDFVVSPGGKMLAFTARGEVFIKEADKEKSRSINISNHPYRDGGSAWLNDSTLLFTSDRADGNFDIYLYRSADTTERSMYKSLKHDLQQITNTKEDEGNLVVSPDGKKISYTRGRGTLVVADISPAGKLSNEKILTKGWATPGDVAWSPDSKWVAYSMTDLYANYEVYIQAADNSEKPVNISMHPRSDGNPVWSADGSKLGFLSQRSVGRSTDVWFVWLKKEDWEKDTQDWQDKEPPAADKADAKTKDKKVQPIKIDFDKIYERTVQVTAFPGDEAELAISKDGETFYYTTATNTAKGRDLYSIKWDGKDLKEITKGGTNPGNVVMDKDGKYLYYTKTGGLGRIDLKTSAAESLPYVARINIDYAAERKQVFEEAWRTIRDGYYDPNFHGQNWNKLHDKYQERIINASTSDDFTDMYNLLLGELNSSHMGFTSPDRAQTQTERTGLIGAEIEAVKNGMKVTHVVAEGPSDKISGHLFAGDIITAVNGEDLKENENFYSRLMGMSGEKILLNVLGGNGVKREVVIRPATSLSENLYEEWVQERRDMVDKWSNGKLGYIHIKSMDFPSFEVVEREFTVAGSGKEGLVIDVRYNGGGSTTDYLMSILNYKQHAYTIPRGASENLEKDKLKFRDYYPIGERLVYAAWTKPSIAICNEGSYSNAEIFSHAYKQLGIGKLVGMPTNGSVISTGGKGFIDGSFIRLPGRGWYTKATDQNQE
ncbi:MAG: S41 family peptidase, partial [Ferruginibacter sp.]